MSSWCTHHITFLTAESYTWPQGHTWVCTHDHMDSHPEMYSAHGRASEHPRSPRHRSTHTFVSIRHTHRPQHLPCAPSPGFPPPYPPAGGQGVLTVGALQLGHGGHEGALGHVALHRGHERLLVGRVQRLRELDGLQGGQAAAHAVDDRHALCLRGGQAWSGGRVRGRPGLWPPPRRPQAQPRPPGAPSLPPRSRGLEEGTS